jgi:hypothetical protein
MRWITYFPPWYRKLLRTLVAFAFVLILGVAIFNGLNGKPVWPLLVQIPIWGAVLWLLRLFVRFNQRYMARMLDEASKWDRD